ncbi:MAG: sugar transferase [Eubacteriales bacterium]|nr:sugar transferase [Eubacteriales bacterium]
MNSHFADIKQEYQNALNTRRIPARKSFYITVVRRLVDIIGSLTGIIVFSPIMLITAIVTAIDVGFPIIFKQVRIGLGGKPFVIYKFRNMTYECDGDGNLLPPDQRLTRFGKIIRKTSLDELPQLFNILKGDMSFIGPRPLLTGYLLSYNDRQFRRHIVKPGFECPTYTKKDHVWTWEERFESDVWYAEHCSLKVDVHQFFRLFQMVFDAKNNQTRSGAAMGFWNPEKPQDELIHK